MATNLVRMSKKIALALSIRYGAHVVIGSAAFYGNTGELVNMLVVKDAYYGENGYEEYELFKSASSVYTLMYMRDLLTVMDGGELTEPDEESGYYKLFFKRDVPKTTEYMKEKYCGTYE